MKARTWLRFLGALGVVLSTASCVDERSPLGEGASPDSPMIWVQQQGLLADDAAPLDDFGTSVAVDGDTAVVGANMKGSDTGAAYVFVRAGASWSLQQKLSPGSAGGYFGTSVAVSGDTVVVGAPDGPLTNMSAVYVFVRSGSTWSQQQVLTASDTVNNDGFGSSVAVSGDTTIAGNSPAGAPQLGAAYVFVRAGSSWSQQQRLAASGGAAGDEFGYPVALSGDTAIVGAIAQAAGQGAAYVFVRAGSSWSQQQALTASDGAAGDQLGLSAAVDGDTVVLGARSRASSTGAAYVFVRAAASWSQQAALTASDGVAGDGLGISVALSGDTALVGAQGKDTERGAAYVFARAGSSWSQQAALTASEGAAHDWFGTAVALSGTTAVAGASQNPTEGKGAAYAFVQEAAAVDPGCVDETKCGVKTATSGCSLGVSAPGTSARPVWLGALALLALHRRRRRAQWIRARSPGAR